MDMYYFLNNRKGEVSVLCGYFSYWIDQGKLLILKAMKIEEKKFGTYLSKIIKQSKQKTLRHGEIN